MYTLLRDSENAVCSVQMMDMVSSQAFYLCVEPARFPEQAKQEYVKYSINGGGWLFGAALKILYEKLEARNWIFIQKSNRICHIYIFSIRFS